ncbi:hypothetical protein O181_096645 [Austropuccinia psidii MF-1]|uniref:Uncharacterized protein n=1 Tax=Austropuccinia psidii MF-1 TaxID=1389203 RepID=A0A9Q3J809_9BASI|nr:hypothetical protein [Austropuccinia psidii MF-1]
MLQISLVGGRDYYFLLRASSWFILGLGDITPLLYLELRRKWIGVSKPLKCLLVRLWSSSELSLGLQCDPNQG